MEVIRLDHVSLWRRTQEEFSYDLKKTILNLVQGRYRSPSKKQILNNIDLVIHQGEKVGIIGANGSGKSTLLKIICGIFTPTSGTVRVRGKIAPLIELGGGFEPEISVVDNIIFYGILLGFSKQEMKGKISSILEFAQLEEYAEIPVKALSSGMTARLGFSIATDVKPDILILDEVLSVGDAHFQSKSKQRMDQLWQANTTVLLVSHDLDFLQKTCNSAILLDKGNIKFIGSVHEAIKIYLE
ncbi:MAG: ABC transporter ATP-binding protein [Synechococcales bacterium]|nr:ABC transporter ATP-binding protein [Cyanobacteria bacterium REEB444]MEB3124755.1 ABC transporter ATP-binding protein [Synechococcales bacterium]